MYDETLEAKLEEIEVKLSGTYERHLEKKEKALIGKITEGITDIAYGETESYKVAAAKWKKTLTCELGGTFWGEKRIGTTWRESISVYFENVITNDRYMFRFHEIQTKNMYDYNENKYELWGFDNLELEILGDDTISITHVNKKSNQSGENETVNLHLIRYQIEENRLFGLGSEIEEYVERQLKIGNSKNALKLACEYLEQKMKV